MARLEEFPSDYAVDFIFRVKIFFTFVSVKWSIRCDSWHDWFKQYWTRSITFKCCSIGRVNLDIIPSNQFDYHTWVKLSFVDFPCISTIHNNRCQISNQINYEWFSILNLIFPREWQSFRVQIFHFVSLWYKQHWVEIKFSTRIIIVIRSYFTFPLNRDWWYSEMKLKIPKSNNF